MSATGTDAIILLADLTRLKAAAGSVRPCQVIGVSLISTTGRHYCDSAHLSESVLSAFTAADRCS